MKSARHLLTIRLSRTLINRRQYLRRSQKLTAFKGKSSESVVVHDQHVKAADQLVVTPRVE